LQDSYFDELRDPNTRLPNGGNLPALFNFTPEEKGVDAALCDRLTPAWYKAQQK
jgi:glycogen synthase kinase 3 beta